MLWSSFLQKQALTGSLQKGCFKELFGKVLRKHASALKKGQHPGCFAEKYAEIFGAVIFSHHQ